MSRRSQRAAMRVESAHVERLRDALADQPVEPRAQLARRLVGEGDRQDVPGRDQARLDQVGDAVDDDAGLARARPGQDEQRPIGMGHRLPLLRVQPLQYTRPTLHDHPAQSKS